MKWHKCSICSVTFETKTELVYHFSAIHATKPIIIPSSDDIQCDWCSKTFTNISNAFRHKSMVHRDVANSYDCKHCGKSFAFSFQFNKHIAIEHSHVPDLSISKFSCEHCENSFTTSQALETHMKKHAFTMPFFVPHASRKLRLNANSEVTPVYYCPHCASEYILKFNLKKHISIDHAELVLFPPDPKEIKTCMQCNAVFFNKKAFDVHNTHTVNDVFMPESGLPNLKVDLD